MKYIEWNSEKNEQLKKQRKVCFEDVINAFENGKLLDTIDHYNKVRYSNQRIFIIEVDTYAYMVPFVEDSDKIFLKTIIPSRKATKVYLKK